MNHADSFRTDLKYDSQNGNLYGFLLSRSMRACLYMN